MLKVEIRIKGQIDQNWSEWFQGLNITHTGEEETLLSGVIQDQAELYGLLARLWNLRLALVSITAIESDPNPKEQISTSTKLESDQN